MLYIFCSHSDLLLAKRRKNLPNWIKKPAYFPSVVAISHTWIVYTFGYSAFGLHLNNSMCCTIWLAIRKCGSSIIVITIVIRARVVFRWLCECAKIYVCEYPNGSCVSKRFFGEYETKPTTLQKKTIFRVCRNCSILSQRRTPKKEKN